MDDASQRPLHFGPIEFLPAQRLVRVDGREAPVGARAIDVLRVLVEHRDRVVTKQELLDRAWPGLVVEENNLQVQISALRKVLGARTIATVPGRGYQFTAMQTVSAAAAPAPAPAPASAPAPAPATASASASMPISVATATATTATAPGPDTDTTPSRGNLPASPPRLIGRDREIADLMAQVRAHRLVTVVGEGGMGKTRLALATAHGLRGAFEQGVWLVDLASLTDATLTASAIAQAMALSLPAGWPVDASLADALRGREALLVLDNCENVLDAVGHVVQTLLHHTALVHVLATSQERLRLPEEHLLRIEPLGIPGGDTLQEAVAASAVALFVERVQALRADFEIDAHNVVAVVDICRQLDGLPLAIELAAARVPMLGVQGVHQRLADRFRLLTSGWRTAGRRHQTLREMLDWSCGLLDATERAIFIRAGVFVGSFSLATAQAVLADGVIDAATVLDALGTLVDKSLIVPDASDPPRLRLLETMRAYALERLDEFAAPAAPLMRRHAQAMQGLLAASEEAAWTVPSQRRLAQILPDLDNIRAAFGWAARHPEAADLHVALAGSSAWVWFLANLRVEGLRRLEGAIERIGPETDASAEARLCAGWVTLRFPVVGPREQAALERAQALFARAGDRRGAYETCWTRIRTAAVVQDVQACQDNEREMEALFDPTWPPIARWELLTVRFLICWCTNPTAVATIVDETLESLRLAEAFGDLRLRATSLMYLEQITEGLGRFDEAVQRGRELLDLLGEVPFTLLRPLALDNLCLSLTHLGRLDEALEAGRESLAEHRLGGTLAMVLDAAALLAMKRGRFEAAALALGRADAAVAEFSGARQPNEVRARTLTLEGLQRALAPADLERLMRAGALLGEDEAACLALDLRG